MFSAADPRRVFLALNGHTGQAIAGVVSLAIIASVTILGWHGVLDSASIVGILGAIGGAGVGGFAAASGAKSTLDSVSQAGGRRMTDPPEKGDTSA